MRTGEAAGPDYRDTGLAFTHPDGTGLHLAQITLLFQQLQHERTYRRYGCTTCATAPPRSAWPPESTSRSSRPSWGHATTGFTQDVYQSVFPDVARQAAEATAELITGTAQ